MTRGLHSNQATYSNTIRRIAVWIQDCPTQFNKIDAQKASILLNHGRGDMIRTCDILLPKQALYQTELRPEIPGIISAKSPNANFYLTQQQKKEPL